MPSSPLFLTAVLIVAAATLATTPALGQPAAAPPSSAKPAKSGSSSGARVVNPLPDEPLEIGAEPQYVLDNFVVDNHWALKYKRQAVRRVFHPPVKHKSNPLIAGEGGYTCVLRDEDDGRFRMWYQTAIIGDPKNGVRTLYGIAYAESEDGLSWKRPKLGLHEWRGSKENNIVWKGIHNRRASSNYILRDIPEKDRRGHRYVMLYSETDGMHLIGSADGIHWERDSDMLISGIHSDTNNAIVYDPRRREYVMFCRAKHIYRTFRGNILDTGASRRVARMSSKKLWTLWDAEPQTILVPDEQDAEIDFNFFYGMPTRRHGGMYWGFLWPFKMNSDIVTELAYSRDGFQFQRLTGHPRLLDLGDEGAWDDGMVFGTPHWVEVGDQWWIYYAGWDGPHGIRERTPGIGLATMRKEGFVSLRGPAGGGVVSTRKIRWPGGDLYVNANAEGGELRVRVTDARRKPLEGFDYQDSITLTGDGVRQKIAWGDKSISALVGRIVRLEFFLKDADLYTFQAIKSEAGKSQAANKRR